MKSLFLNVATSFRAFRAFRGESVLEPRRKGKDQPSL